MFKSIKEVFDADTKSLKVDPKFVKAGHMFERHFVNKNEDHVVFLGGALMGTPRFVFTNHDRHEFFDDIAELDEVTLKLDIDALPTVDKNHKVASDALNQTIAYLIHRIMNSSLSQTQKDEGMVALLKIMHYRWLSSLMHNYFPYEPDKQIMEATYYALNRKFSLKVHGSWSKLLESRCRDIISRDSLHYKTLEKFTDDAKIQYFITDSQGRIREVVKKMYRVFLDVHKNSAKVLVRKDLVDLEGEMHVRELIREDSTFKRYANDVMTDKDTFIKQELLSVIVDAVHTAPERHVRTTLEYMTNNYGLRGDKNIGKLIDEVMLHAFEYIAENKADLRGGTNLGELVKRLKALYTSSRTTDSSVINMRDLSYKISKKAIKTSNDSLLSSVRTSIMLYIVLRAFSMPYYT